MKFHNFNAGPCVLPREVVEKTSKQLLDFDGHGIGLAEISHRAKYFQPVVDEAEALIKELLDIPAGYRVIFLGGGASLQFTQIPANFLIKKAGYINSGAWAKKALKEAKYWGEAIELASTADINYVKYPEIPEVPADLDYLHITSNNTIYGTEILKDPDVPVRLIADMSSDIMSRPVDVSKYDAIYGGAQKNMSMAGITVIIVKEDALGKREGLPTMLDYRTHTSKGSMFNTPPVVPLYCLMENMRWVKAQGGIKEMDRRAQERADLLYGEIDRNKLFVGTAEEKSRSRMNICFVMQPEYQELADEFFKFATEKGMVGIKGHRSVGGFRASCYNAEPLESVQALVDCMKEFEAKH